MTRNLIYIERIANNDTFIVSISRNQISAMCICCYTLTVSFKHDRPQRSWVYLSLPDDFLKT